MKNKILGSNDYKDELANIVETRGFGEESENLLLSMLYKTEDGYTNYLNVKREVPDKNEFMETVVGYVRDNCKSIIIAKPNTPLANDLKASRCKILDNGKQEKKEQVISFPNEKTLLYGVAKTGIKKIDEQKTLEEKAILTTIGIGKCISMSEVIRDFNGWSWSILEREIESIQCNVVYIFLTYLLGYKYVNSIENISDIKEHVSEEFFEELKKVSVQFYLSYDKGENEEVLKELAKYKAKLLKMKNQMEFQEEITKKKKQNLNEIKHIDEMLNNPQELKKEYVEVNSKLPNEQKIFSVSNYEEILENKREEIIKEIGEFNRLQNPNEFMQIKDELLLKIKLYEEKTDISKLEKEFLRCFEQRMDNATDKKEILDLVYETRYLNFIPNCKMKLNEIEEKLIPKAIKYRVLNPISNNNELDYRILKGIFETQVVSLEGLYIQLSVAEKGINVELFDGDIHDRTYIATTPEGSDIEIRRSKKTKIFE